MRTQMSTGFSPRKVRRALFGANILWLVLCCLCFPLGAQQTPFHLNPAVEKLAKGQPMIGTFTDDMSLQNCHAMARLDFDYVYVDMEHGPLNLDGLAFCAAAMVDKAAALK